MRYFRTGTKDARSGRLFRVRLDRKRPSRTVSQVWNKGRGEDYTPVLRYTVAIIERVEPLLEITRAEAMRMKKEQS